MSRFLFGRSSESENDVENGVRRVAPPPAAAPAPSADTRALVDLHAITTSAIFAALVSRNVMTPHEASECMTEIAGAIDADVGAPVGPDASAMLRAYAGALRAAAG